MDLNQIVRELVAKGVVVEFISERVSFRPGATDPFAKFQLNIMASFAQLERSITKERQAEGIRAAMARGVYKGRAHTLTAQQLTRARELIATGVPKSRIARQLGVDRFDPVEGPGPRRICHFSKSSARSTAEVPGLCSRV